MSFRERAMRAAPLFFLLATPTALASAHVFGEAWGAVFSLPANGILMWILVRDWKEEELEA